MIEGAHKVSAGTNRVPSAACEPKLSILVPIKNEATNLDTFFSRMSVVLAGLGMTYEIICIDDGSTDASLPLLIEQHRRNPSIKIVGLSRNFGKDAALSAGLDYAQGAAVIPIDADLQDPPEVIPLLVAKWHEGFEVVNATRLERAGEGWIKTTTAKLFYRIFAGITDTPIPLDTGDFRLLDRKVVEVLVRLPERTRFMKGLFSWVGFRQASVVYNREARHSGNTNWGYAKLWNFAIDGVASFSSLPLKIWSYLGFAISLFAFFYATFLAALKLSRGIDVPGYASLMVVVLFLGGVQLITLGIVGEYLGRIYNEVKARPIYVVRDTFGLQETSSTSNQDLTG